MRVLFWPEFNEKFRPFKFRDRSICYIPNNFFLTFGHSVIFFGHDSGNFSKRLAPGPPPDN